MFYMTALSKGISNHNLKNVVLICPWVHKSNSAQFRNTFSQFWRKKSCIQSIPLDKNKTACNIITKTLYEVNLGGNINVTMYCMALMWLLIHKCEILTILFKCADTLSRLSLCQFELLKLLIMTSCSEENKLTWRNASLKAN